MIRIARYLGEELLSHPGVVPPAGSAVLILGEPFDISFPPDVLTLRRAWNEPIGELKHFDRVICLAGKNCPNPEATLKQATQLVRADGLFVLVSARPWPWGAKNTPWWKGIPLRWWIRHLRANHWVIVETDTIGFANIFWKRMLPWAGIANVTIAQKRVGGLRIIEPSLSLPAMKKPLPGACANR